MARTLNFPSSMHSPYVSTYQSNLRGVEYFPMKYEDFIRIFETKERFTQGNLVWDCYGTYRGDDISYSAETQELARYKAYQGLVRMKYVESPLQIVNRISKS
jgi:hypothetical protein